MYYICSTEINVEKDTEHKKVNGKASSGMFEHKGIKVNLNFQDYEAKTKLPLLLDHNLGQRVGVITHNNNENELFVSGSLFKLGTNKFVDEIIGADELEFPWELSIGFESSKRIKLSEKEFEMSGIKILEISLCTIGKDRGTTVNLLSAEFNVEEPKKKKIIKSPIVSLLSETRGPYDDERDEFIVKYKNSKDVEKQADRYVKLLQTARTNNCSLMDILTKR